MEVTFFHQRRQTIMIRQPQPITWLQFGAIFGNREYSLVAGQKQNGSEREAGLQRQEILNQRISAQLRHNDLAGMTRMQRRGRGFAVDDNNLNAGLSETPHNAEPTTIVRASDNDGGCLCARHGGQHGAIGSWLIYSAATGCEKWRVRRRDV